MSTDISAFFLDARGDADGGFELLRFFGSLLFFSGAGFGVLVAFPVFAVSMGLAAGTSVVGCVLVTLFGSVAAGC